MSIVIDNSFTVDAPPDQAFALMSDIERVSPCIPGAELVGHREDGGYDIRVKMKVGPMNLAYNGSVLITEQDPSARRATLRAQATEQRGQGTATAELRMEVNPMGADNSQVAVHSDMLVTGRVAQMGRGIMVDVANRMITEMARAVNATLSESSVSTPPSSEAASGRSDARSMEAPASARPPSSHPANAADGAPAPLAPGPGVRADTPKIGRLFWQILWTRLRQLVGLGSAADRPET